MNTKTHHYLTLFQLLLFLLLCATENVLALLFFALSSLIKVAVMSLLYFPAHIRLTLNKY